MAQPRVLVLRAPGTNCDGEAVFAFNQAGAAASLMHVQALLANPSQVAEFQILCLPGGFSYGDDIAAGRIFGNQIRHHLAEVLAEFREQQKLILGICNGFQILIKSGLLLPYAEDYQAPATLTWNDSLRFEDRWVPLHVASNHSVFFAGLDSLYLPVAHAEGKFVPRSEDVLKQLTTAGQVVLRYGQRGSGTSQPAMAATIDYPDNPNGSLFDIAGVCDATGRVCGLMPHPERFVDATQHPRWTRGDAHGEGKGLRVFRNAVEYFR